MGAKCVAAPLKDYNGKIVGCISVTGPSKRMNKDRILKISNIVKEKAVQISKLLGYVD